MSVIIDLLKENTDDSKTREKLAETYFPRASTPSGRKKRNGLRITALLAMIFFFGAVLYYVIRPYGITIDIGTNKRADVIFEHLLITQKVNLFGTAVDKKGHVSLVNGTDKRRSGITIDLKNPVDLSNKHLLISVLPKAGKDKLKVIFRDKNYRSYISNILDVEDTKKDWQNFIVSSGPSKESIDVRNIRHIRLEVEGGAGEAGASEIYIKEVALIDNLIK